MSRSLSTLVLVLGPIELHSGSADPSAGGGVVAPVGSYYWRTDAVQWTKIGAGDTQWVSNVVTTELTGWFGNGIDGDVTISGSTTLNRSQFYNNLTVQNGGILIPQSKHLIYVSDTLTVDAGGLIHVDGGNAVNQNGGSTGGRGGGGANGTGTNGNNASTIAQQPSPLTGGALGGRGGDGASVNGRATTSIGG